jgi:replicative DNA helicase
VPPHNFDAEESVLGAMLLSRDAIAVVVEQVTTEDFYKPSHAHIYDAITSLYARGEPADSITVPEELRRLGVLDASGGAAALIALQANTPAISSAGRYARIVQEHALLRRLIGVAHEIAEIGYELPVDVAGALDQAEAMVFDVAQRRSSDSVRSLKELLTESLERLDHLYDRGETITGVPTGYGELDHLLSGLQPSNLVVVGARPSMGKTAFALGLATHAASNHGVPVLFFSLEMSHLEIAQRVLAAEARLDVTKLRNGRLLDSDWPKISSAIGRIDTAPLFIDDNPNVTIMDIRAKARRMRSSDDIGLVVIDYLQLMTGRSSAENRQVEISEISRGLKILARELQLPVVALSQLSRGLEARADKRPMLADLRECLSGETAIARADTNTPTTIGKLARSNERNVPVWSLGEDRELVPSVMAGAWSTGVKPVSRIRFGSGREVRATSNHPFLTRGGWTPVEELAVGHRVATGRCDPRSRVVSWDPIIAIDTDGESEVFDASVPGTHSFLANGLVAHNSGAIEQDADVVMFIYRDEVYNSDSADRGTAEVLVAKHRNGPTGAAHLAFIANYAKFGDLARV